MILEQLRTEKTESRDKYKVRCQILEKGLSEEKEGHKELLSKFEVGKKREEDLEARVGELTSRCEHLEAKMLKIIEY